MNAEKRRTKRETSAYVEGMRDVVGMLRRQFAETPIGAVVDYVAAQVDAFERVAVDMTVEPTPEQPEWMRDAMAAKSRGRALGGRIDKLMWAGDVAALDQAFAWAKGNVSPDMALGLLVFTLPVRTKLAHRPAFLEWARTVLTVDDLDGVE